MSPRNRKLTSNAGAAFAQDEIPFHSGSEAVNLDFYLHHSPGAALMKMMEGETDQCMTGSLPESKELILRLHIASSPPSLLKLDKLFESGMGLRMIVRSSRGIRTGKRRR